MKYLINNIINYDSHLGLLFSDNIDNAIKLTTTSNRLLLVLVQNNNNVLNRNFLLNRVWKEHNQVVSENNLNNNISVLRRHLAIYSDEEMIITIPKMGVRFSAELEFKNREEEEITKIDDSSLPLQNENSSTIKNEVNDKIVTSKKNYMLDNKYLEFILVVIIVFCLLYIFKNYFISNNIEYPEVGKIEQCSIRYINSYHKPKSTAIDFSILQEKIIDLNIDCKKLATIFYYDIDTITHDNNMNDNFMFLSYCPNTPKNGATVSCENFYVK